MQNLVQGGSVNIQKAYAASFRDRFDGTKKYAPEVSDMLQEILEADLLYTLREKAYILLGVCRLVKTNSTVLYGSVNSVWKSMNVSQTLGTEKLLELSPRKQAKRRTENYTIQNNALLEIDIDQEWPPYKLPKLAYDPSPASIVHHSSIHPSDFPLDNTLDSNLSSFTDSMGSYQSNLFGEPGNEVLFDITRDIVSSPEAPQATLTPDPSPNGKRNNNSDLLDPQDYDMYNGPGLDIEPEILFEAANDSEQPVQQKPTRTRKIKFARISSYTDEQLENWYNTYNDFCAKSQRRSITSTFERVFWGPDNYINRKRKRNRERRAQRLLKLQQRAEESQNANIVPEPLQAPTPGEMAQEDEDVIMEESELNDFDGRDMDIEISQHDSGGESIPPSPMLEIRHGDSNYALHESGLFAGNETLDPSQSHSRLDQTEMFSIFDKFNTSDSCTSGIIPKEHDNEILDRINNVGGTSSFDSLHTGDRLDAGQAFFSILRLAHEGKVSAHQESDFGQITLTTTFRPH